MKLMLPGVPFTTHSVQYSTPQRAPTATGHWSPQYNLTGPKCSFAVNNFQYQCAVSLELGDMVVAITGPLADCAQDKECPVHLSARGNGSNRDGVCTESMDAITSVQLADNITRPKTKVMNSLEANRYHSDHSDLDDVLAPTARIVSFRSCSLLATSPNR